MWSQLKPLPKFILILLILIGVTYGVANFTNFGKSMEAAVQQSSKGASTGGAAITPTLKQNVPPPTSFDSYARVQQSRELKIAVQGNAAPFYDRGRGFNPDFLSLLTRQPEFAGVRVTVLDETDTYEQVPLSLLKTNNGQPLVDIAVDGLTFQDGDVPGVTFTQPYVSGFGYSLITSRSSNIRDLESVGNARVGILKGDPDVLAYVQRMFPNAQLVELSDALVSGQRTWIRDAFTAGNVDAMVYDYPFAVSEIAGTALQFAVSKLPESDISYKIAVRAQDSNLVQKLNAAIQRAVETEDYRALLRTYFSSRQIVTKRAVAGERTYNVKSGDTLAMIAKALLGDAKRYREIEIRNNLPNPNLIQVGQVLVIPS